MKVFVYFNLHTHLWSIKSLEGEHKGLVVAHAKSVALLNVTMKVSEAGRQRVLLEQKKNVHAGLEGEWVAGHGVNWKKYPRRLAEIFGGQDISGSELVSYNPYRAPKFFLKDSPEDAVLSAPSVLMLGRSVFTWGAKTVPMGATQQLDLFGEVAA
jgi:hypothetical protein